MLCNVIQKTDNTRTTSLDNSQNKIFEKVESYLKRYTNSKFPIDDINWKEIKSIRMVRNRIVHHEAIVEKNNKGCIDYIVKSKYLETRNALEECHDFDNHDRLLISIKQGFLNHYLKLFELFIEDVFKTLDVKVKRANIIPSKFLLKISHL